MNTLAQTFDLALRHHQAGNLQQAEELYRQILATHPNHVDALHLLGVIAGQVGRPEIAVTYIRQALSLKPDFALAHKNLGKYLEDQGKLDEAAASYLQALRYQPDFAEAHFNLGNVYREQDKAKEAADQYRQALRLHSDHADAHNNLGIVLRELGHLDDAAAHCIQAFRLRPDHFLAISNLGIVLRDQGKIADAEDSFREAIRLKPDYVPARNNLGCALRDQGKLVKAAACYQESIHLQPDFAEAHANLGMIRLLTGDYEKGWAETEWLRKRKKALNRNYPQPLWDGTILESKTIFLYAEQGLGDTIQFIRFAGLVKQRGGHVLVECQAPLVRLLGDVAGVYQVLAPGQPLPPFDVHLPLMSLPGILKTTLATVPSNVPYLTAEPALVDYWRDELKPIEGFKIGIVWQGSPTQLEDRQRSVPLAQFAPLAAVPGVRLLSLQVGPGSEQLAHASFPVTDLGSRFDPNSLHDLAAVLANLDLVVTVCTSVAHLAGALAVSAWVALKVVPFWCWQLEGPISPWYPTLRLFRQRRLGEWGDVFQEMTRELDNLVGEP
jgi:tetratricopeptide (TPR) repeat protein